jgi:hypothetical protein
MKATLPRISQRLATKLRLLPSLAFVGMVYVFFVSAGLWSTWPLYGTFHDLLAEGFRSGHLYIPVRPAPELLKAANPYDLANGRYWVWDASYFHGKYYVYWGPVPALIWALVKIVLGIGAIVGDQYLAFAFLFLSVWSGALLIERLAQRLFRDVPRWAVLLAIATFAFAHPALHAVTTASTYHTAIAAGQAFALAGVVLSFDAVWHAGTDRARRWRFLAAGACWALAIGSRVSLAPTVALIALVTAAAGNFGTSGRWWRGIIVNLTLQAVPVVLLVMGLLMYNKVRFERWLEFGTNLQLSAYPFRLSPAYIMANLYSYLLRPGEWSCRFPFLYQVWEMKDAFPMGLDLPKGYLVNEPVVGWVRVVPVTWLIPFAFALTPRGPGWALRSRRVYLWCLFSFLVLGTASGALVMGLYMATMRYQNDVMNGLLLLSILAGFALVQHPFAKFVPRAAALSFILPAVASILFGVLLGYQGYNAHFLLFNPDLDRKIVHAFSLCGDDSVRPPRFAPGP